MTTTTSRRRLIGAGLFAAVGMMACAASTAAHADFWDRRYRAQEATEFAGNILGAIAGAAASERNAQEEHCRVEERRVKTERSKVVLRQVKVCD